MDSPYGERARPEGTLPGVQIDGEREGAPDGVLTEAIVEGRPGPGPDAGDAGREQDAGGPLEPDGPTAPDASVDAVDHLLEEVEEALSRLDDGTYGRCASCAEPIDDARLADDPTATECASCTPRRDG
jgi:DnaK suppressor protein